MTTNLKNNGNKETLKKMVLILLIMALTAGLYGCTKSTKNVLAEGVTLDESKINESTTTARDRNDYYYEHYDKYLDDMTTEEQKEFLVHVYVDTTSSEENQNDEIMFLRNDSTYVGSVPATGGEIYIPLGDYVLVSLTTKVGNKSFGKLKVLHAGETVKLHVDVDLKASEYSVVENKN